MPDDTVLAIAGSGEGGGGGQHVIQKITEGAEVVTPWQQGKRFALAAFVIYLGLTGALLVLGKALFYIAGFVSCTTLMIWGGRKVRMSWWIALLVWVALTAALFGAGPRMLDMIWPTRFDLTHPMIEWGLKLWALGFIAIVVIVPLLFVVYRYASEIIDPTGPTAPRTASPWPGTIWPWQTWRVWRAVNPPQEPEKVIVETHVPYPVPVQANSNRMVQGTARQLPEGQRPPPPKMWRAHSGNLVQFKDLLRFAELAPDCGATYRPWQEKGWKFEYWQDIVDIWAVYGATNARDREAKETTLFLLSTEEAMRRLLESA